MSKSEREAKQAQRDRAFETAEKKRDAAANVGKTIGVMYEAAEAAGLAGLSARDAHEHLTNICSALKRTAGVFDAREPSRISDRAAVAQLKQRRETDKEAMSALRTAKELLQAALHRKLEMKQLRAVWGDEISRPAFRWMRLLLNIMAGELPLWKRAKGSPAKPAAVSSPPEQTFQDHRTFAARKLKGKARRIVELVCEANGACPLADLAIDSQINWRSSIDNACSQAIARINGKLEGEPWRLRRRDNKVIVQQNMKMPKKA